MSKLSAAAAVTGVGGTGAAGTYAAYHFEVFGGGSGGEAGAGQVSGITYNSLPLGTTSSKQHQGQCFRSTSNGGGGVFDKWLNNGVIGESNLTPVTKTEEVRLDESGTAKGCLDFEWRQGSTSGSRKWEGSSFRLVWVMSRGNKGFSVSLIATGKQDKTFEFDGIAYFFERENDGWKTTKKLEMKGDSKTLSGEVIKTKWPKKKQTLLSSWQLNEYWNFLNESGDDIKTDNSNSHNYVQTVRFSSSGETSVGEWTSNLSDWWDHFFDKSKWDISQTIQNIKGTWT